MLWKNEAVLKKAGASNQWNYYQAKSTKQNLAELAAALATNPERAQFYKQEAERYDKEKKEIRAEVKRTLNELYKLHPKARGAIAKSAGYAVFDNFGTNLGVLSTASGKGIAYDSASKKETFMKMYSAGVGLGLGVKDYRVVFVFENRKALNDFVNSGWEGSGQADAAAKAGDTGGAVSGAKAVSPGVWVYQFTKNGLAAQVTLQGTKYWKNDELN